MTRVMREAMAQEARLQAMLEETKESICRDILAEGPLDGVTVNNKLSISIGIVKLSTLVQEQNWAPEFLFPKSQAKIVRRKLTGAKSVSDLVVYIQDMVNTGVVRFGREGSYQLNKKTISVLRRYL